MAVTLPEFKSSLSQVMQVNNFVALQSVKINVTAASGSVTFSAPLPGTLRLTAKITNTGTTGCYLASGQGSATAVVSTTTPSPANGIAISNCDYIAAGSILTQDYIQGTDTFAAICAAAGTTTLEVSIGMGQ